MAVLGPTVYRKAWDNLFASPGAFPTGGEVEVSLCPLLDQKHPFAGMSQLGRRDEAGEPDPTTTTSASVGPELVGAVLMVTPVSAGREGVTRRRC